MANVQELKSDNLYGCPPHVQEKSYFIYVCPQLEYASQVRSPQTITGEKKLGNIQSRAVLKETLENRGVLGQMKARMRAEVFHALDDQLESRPPLSNENMLINELIREYLEFNSYKYSLSVLMAETGQPQTPLDRSFLTNELNITEDRNATKLPLLYGVLSHFLESKRLGFSFHQPQCREQEVRTNPHRHQQRDYPYGSHGGKA